jgi:hypothetical protein
LFAASKAQAVRRGGVVRSGKQPGSRIARLTAIRALVRGQLEGRVLRPDGGRMPATETQPGLLNALNQLAQPSTRGDPEAAVVWVSMSQRHLAAALAADGSPAARSWWPAATPTS